MSYDHELDRTSSLPTNLHICPLKRYVEMSRRSLEDPGRFWAEEARKLDWYKTWDRVIDWNPPYARWFVGGKLNACYQCVDRHVKTWRRSKVAIASHFYACLCPNWGSAHRKFLWIQCSGDS